MDQQYSFRYNNNNVNHNKRHSIMRGVLYCIVLAEKNGKEAVQLYVLHPLVHWSQFYSHLAICPWMAGGAGGVIAKSFVVY